MNISKNKIDLRYAIKYTFLLFLVSPFIAFQLTYTIFVLLYLFKVFYLIKIADTSPVNRSYLVMFLSSIAVFALLAAAHYPVVTSPEFMRTVELTLIFAAMAMVMDSFSFIARVLDIDVRGVAEKGIWLIAIILIGKFTFAATQVDPEQWHQLYSIHSRRNPITDYNPNHADDHFVYALLVLIWFYVLAASRSLSTNIVGFLCLIVIAFLIVQSGSLGGLIGVFFGFVAVLPFLTIEVRRLEKKIMALGLVAAIAVTVFLAIAQTNTGDRLRDMPSQISILAGGIVSGKPIAYCDPNAPGEYPRLADDYSREPSLALRALLYEAGIKLWLDRPILGHGGFYRYSNEVSDHTIGECLFNNFTHLHNLYLDIIVHGGLLLLFFYIAVFIYIIYSLYLMYKNEKISVRMTSILILFYIIYMIVENFFDHSFVSAAALKANLLGLSGIWALTQSYAFRNDGSNNSIS